MAKGGYQRRRIEAKKAAERAARKRARRRRLVMTWMIGLVLLGLIASVALVAMQGGDDQDLAAEGSATPTPTPTAASECPGEPKKTYAEAPATQIDRDKTYTATMKTSKGTIVVRLLDDDAPKTVNNFVFLAREKFYDNSPFHRVIAGFGGPGSDMVQGGDATACNGTGDPGYDFEDENLIPMNEPGLLAMANSGPGTNGSQFFLLNGKVAHLNAEGSCPGPQGCHSVFGKVLKGRDVIGKIAASPLEGERPSPPIILESVRIKES